MLKAKEVRELASILNNVANEMEKEKAKRVKIYGLWSECAGHELIAVSTSKKRLQALKKSQFYKCHIEELENY